MDVLQLDVEDEEEVLARVAAIDVAKATGMVCTRSRTRRPRAGE